MEYEPISNQHQCIFQDLNFPYTNETEISGENNSRIEQEDLSEVIQIAAECLVHLSAVSFNQVQESNNSFTLFGQKIEPSNKNWFGKRSEKAITSSESNFFDLNETPVYEPISNQHQCIFQDLNFPYTEETEISGKNNSKIEQEDLSEEIQIAAECLVHLSAVSFNQIQESNSSFQDQGFLKKPEMCIEEPSCRSCDSYELRVLGVRETIPEDVFCVSSKAVDEFNYNKKEEFGVKVRRGKRRMKNFQREILPELVSLSRNEICEDINIFEADLRSKEYKKMHGKTRDGECKDSTQRYEGKRRRRTK